jgi:hypothetical protein
VIDWTADTFSAKAFIAFFHLPDLVIWTEMALFDLPVALAVFGVKRSVRSGDRNCCDVFHLCRAHPKPVGRSPAAHLRVCSRKS